MTAPERVKPTQRQCVVPTAQCWFDSAREAQHEGRLSEALLYMENAFNHTENALAASRRDHTALQKVLVGDTGLSAILEATRLRKLHPLSEKD